MAKDKVEQPQPQQQMPGMMPAMGGAGPMAQMMQMMQMMMGQVGGVAGVDPAAQPFTGAEAVPDEDDELMADIVRPATLETLLKQQVAIPTGTVLDRMCLTEDGEHALGGIPKGCTIAFCGPPGKGKSRTALAAMAQVAASGGKVAYVVAEEGFVDPDDSGRDDLCSRLTKICMASQGLDEAGFREKIAPNLWIMLSQYHRGHAWSDFVNRYRYLVEKEGIDFVVIDSLNTLDPSRNKTAENLATLKTYNHEKGITCLTIGQIRDTGAPAGGEALMHTADVVYLMEYLNLSSKDMAALWGGTYRERILTIRTVKSISTPIVAHPVRVTQTATEGKLVLHPDHPLDAFSVPEIAP